MLTICITCNKQAVSDYRSFSGPLISRWTNNQFSCHEENSGSTTTIAIENLGSLSYGQYPPLEDPLASNRPVLLAGNIPAELMGTSFYNKDGKQIRHEHLDSAPEVVLTIEGDSVIGCIGNGQFRQAEVADNYFMNSWEEIKFDTPFRVRECISEYRNHSIFISSEDNHELLDYRFAFVPSDLIGVYEIEETEVTPFMAGRSYFIVNLSLRRDAKLAE